MKRFSLALTFMLGVVASAYAEAPRAAPFAVDLVNTYGMISCDHPLQVDLIAKTQEKSTRVAEVLVGLFEKAPSTLRVNGELLRINTCSEESYLREVWVFASQALPDTQQDTHVVKRWKLTVREYLYAGTPALREEYDLRRNPYVYDNKEGPLFLETTVLWMEQVCDSVDNSCEGFVAKYIPLGEKM